MELMDLGEGSAGETLSSGRDRPRRRWLVPVLVALVGLLVAASTIDRVTREREVDALIEDVEAVSTAVSLADQRVTAMQQYIRPVAASRGLPDRLTADLDSLVGDAGAEGSRQMLSQRAMVEENAVLPWHDEVREAQRRLGDYAASQAERLSAAGDGSAAAGVAADRALFDAVTALRAAVVEPGQAVRLEQAVSGLPGVRDLPSIGAPTRPVDPTGDR